MRTPKAPGTRALASRLAACPVLMLLAGCGAEAPRAEVAPVRIPAPDATGPVDGFRTVTVAHIALELESGAPLVLLHKGWDQVLPIWIGEPEAAAILRALDGEIPPRPTTHDLALSILDTAGGALFDVRVTARMEATYLGQLTLVGGSGSRAGSGPLSVDARPSDAIALALRAGVPVRVADPLWDDLPLVDFVSVGRGPGTVRARGLTLRDGPSVDLEVIDVDPLEAGRGLSVGDVIVAAHGRPIDSPADWVQAVRARGPETMLEVERDRGGVRSIIRLPESRAPVVSG
jgi:uncharacterized protein